MRKFLLFLAFALAAAPVAARGGFSASQRQACAADFQKLCADVMPGGGRIVTCLREHAASLSEACRAAIDEAAAERDAKRKACEADYRKFCADVAPGGGEIVKCLKTHTDQLDAACRNVISGAAQGGAR